MDNKNLPIISAVVMQHAEEASFLQQVLRKGLQRQRAVGAIELAMMNSGQPFFEVRVPGFRQKKTLGLN